MVKKLVIVTASILLMITLLVPANATNSNKDNINKESSCFIRIYVKGENLDGNYYLDLLVKDTGKKSVLNITDSERKSISKLANYSKDGWHPALLGGSNKLITGSIKGTRLPDGTYYHEFGYEGLPEHFKIIALYDGEVKVSKEIERDSTSDMTINYDIDVSGAYVKTSFESFIYQCVYRFAFSMLLIFLISFGYGFSMKGAWKVLLFTNIFMQLGVDLLLYFSNKSYSMAVTLFLFLLAHVLIIALEILIYGIGLKEKPFVSRISLAVTSNCAVFGVGVAAIIFGMVVS